MKNKYKNTNLPQRKSNRLKEYDYSSAGAYFVTLCSYSRKQIFSRIVGAIHESPLQKRSLISKIVGYLKANTSKEIHKKYPDMRVWQRNYFDHIIRNDEEYQMISECIYTNPGKWEEDRFFLR